MIGWKKINNGSLCGIITIPENFMRVDLSKNSINNNIENKTNNHSVAIIICGTLLCIMAYYMLRWWKNDDQRHTHQRLNNA